MITLTFNTLGLSLAGVVIFIGLMIPMAENEGDNWAGFAYAACVIVLAAMLYLMAVGIGVVTG